MVVSVVLASYSSVTAPHPPPLTHPLIAVVDYLYLLLWEHGLVVLTLRYHEDWVSVPFTRCADALPYRPHLQWKICSGNLFLHHINVITDNTYGTINKNMYKISIEL